MEIKINKEIRDYQEAVFMGLSLRQFLFSLLACGVAIGIYFGLKDVLGTETVSWLCIIGAFPFAILGFVKYHGMTAEKAIMAQSHGDRRLFRVQDLCGTYRSNRVLL